MGDWILPPASKRARELEVYGDLSTRQGYVPPGTGYFVGGVGGQYDERLLQSGWRGSNTLGGSMEHLRNGVSYGASALPGTDVGGLGGLSVSGNGGLSSLGMMSSLADASTMRQGTRIGALEGIGVGSVPARQVNLPRGPEFREQLDGLPSDASSTIFVEGVPVECTRREVAHVFRPFIGFKEVRLVLKDLKRGGMERVALCFVEFADAKCAATALEALQGYKFDENDPQSQSLRLVFAKNPAPRSQARGRRPI